MPLGHVLACFSDCFTRQGVQLFWPEPMETLNFADKNPTERLQPIAIANPGRQVYLSGTLTVDYPEGIMLQPLGRQYETAVLAGESLTMEMPPLALGVLQLSDQWVMGSLMAQVQ